MSNYDVVFHIDKADSSLMVAFRNFLNYAAALVTENYQAVLVVNSAAVTLLKADNVGIKEFVERAVAAGLSVRVCANALADNEIRPEELYPQCDVVPAGIVEIVRLQGEGFAYIKP